LLPFVSHTCRAQFLDLALLFPLYMLCILYLNCTKFSWIVRISILTSYNILIQTN
jgi:hypothetical protein